MSAGGRGIVALIDVLNRGVVVSNGLLLESRRNRLPYETRSRQSSSKNLDYECRWVDSCELWKSGPLPRTLSHRVAAIRYDERETSCCGWRLLGHRGVCDGAPEFESPDVTFNGMEFHWISS